MVATRMFSKLLTETDIKKRLAIPVKILPSLPGFNGSHAVRIQLMYGTRIWPIVCTVRKQGYKKPVFSGGLWRNFVICNSFNVGDRITMFKVQYEDGSCLYRVEVEKLADSNQYGDLQLHKASDAPIKQEEDIPIMELPNVANGSFVDHVIAKPPVRIFVTNTTDEMKCLGDTKDTDMGEPPLLSPCMAKGERKFNFGEACCCNIITDQRLSLDLTLAPPNMEGV
ncbi:hypothetical protein E1A91_A04G169000v1 [Gossypium mustelinum]|uniref:TF-B3 domain-containing protein n=1 Tax=Gossypium mustelinum TaxID=34275 RepID=A0A5D2ZR91_GOSMU|nr:hypothetical protein E1A91_A04G169000v1 [Gossypium mustelinum]